ncbi:MAG TPA: glycosyltransferase 87 family protein [Candidatus Dormibacteraeota bacterium]|nr:glycosyltransferase 87 family protein [Candidatus Dormibacteraeota bacterium]
MAAQRGIRRRQRLLVVFTAVLVLAYVRQLAIAPTAGQDFRAFFAAATVAAQGADPYNWAALGRTEEALYNAPAQIRPGDPTYYDFLPYPEGPWLALALEPLTGLKWQTVYPIFGALMLLAIALGSWLILARLGWPQTRRRVAVAVATLSPIAFFNIFQGQVSALVFLGFAGAWYLAWRGQPVAGGLALTLVWIKPNLGLALPLVVALLEPPAARRLLISFVGGSVLAFGAAALALPGVLIHWPAEILSHWRAAQGTQPDIASIHSFYYPALSGPLKTIALVVVMLSGCAYAAWALRRIRAPLARGLTVLLLWFVLLPYVHSFDAILLLPVLTVLLAPDLRGWEDATTEVALWAFAIVPFGYFVGWHLGFFNGFTAIPIALLLLAWHRRAVTPRPSALPEARAA